MGEEEETQVAVVEHQGREQLRRPREFILKDGQTGSNSMDMASRGCTHLFVTEQVWMEPVIRGEGVTEGPLACPKCAGKVGTFSWIGMVMVQGAEPFLLSLPTHRHKVLVRRMGCSRLCPAQE